MTAILVPRKNLLHVLYKVGRRRLRPDLVPGLFHPEPKNNNILPLVPSNPPQKPTPGIAPAKIARTSWSK